MRKLVTVLVLILGISYSLFSQLLPANKLIISKEWWASMSMKYPGFHGAQSRWMSTGDFNQDGLADVVLQFAAVGTSKMFWQDSLIDSRKFKAVFLNRGKNVFELDTNMVYSFNGGDDGHIILDMNGDGYLDVYQPTDNWHGPRSALPKWYDDSENMGEFMFINKANKSFQGSFFNETGGSTRHYQIIDIDKDGDDELAFFGLMDELPKTIPMRYPHEDSIQVFDYQLKFQRKTLQLFQRNTADSLFKNRVFVPMFSKQDTLFGLLKDPRNELGSSKLDMFGYITASDKKVISSITIPKGLSRKPFHNSGRQGFVQDLDADGKNEYLFSFWNQNDETTYAVIFNENGQDISYKFFADSLNYKIGKIRAGISDVFDDINNDGYVDILPMHGIGFRHNKQNAYFLFNPKLKKYEVKKLHNFPIVFDSDLSTNDSLSFWPHYDYKSHTTFLQYFNKRKDQDVIFSNIVAYKMNCEFVDRPSLAFSSASLCLQKDSLTVKLKTVNANSNYSLSFNNKTVEFNSLTNLTVIKELGSVYITETNRDGCVLMSDTLVITPKKIPMTPTISSVSELSFCSGGNIVLTSNAKSNLWYVNGSVINNATGSSFVASAPGEYRVKAVEEGCFSPLSTPITVKVNTIPTVPTISQDVQGSLTSSSLEWNQWYFNDIKIDNANQNTLTPTQSGFYTVKVVSPCGTEISKPFSVVITSTEEFLLRQVQVSPNPFTYRLEIHFPADFGLRVQVKIYDMGGNILFKRLDVQDGELLDLDKLNDGNYLLQVSSSNQSSTKLIKLSKVH